MIRLEIPLRAVPKGRPRSGNGRVYTPARTKDFEDYCRFYMNQQHKGPLLEGPLNVAIICYGNPRGDVDNLAKSLMDAAAGAVYINDSQVMDLWIRKDPAKIDMILMLVEPRE